MAGLGFALHYATDIGFGLWFFLLNLPFYWLALRKWAGPSPQNLLHRRACCRW